MKLRRGIMGGALLFAAGCVPAGETPNTDTTSNCYEAPQDTAALIGTPCEWPDAVECSVQPWIKCSNGTWDVFPEASGTVYMCEPAIVDCAPAGKVNEDIVGVGFVGLTHEGTQRYASKRLRLV